MMRHEHRGLSNHILQSLPQSDYTLLEGVLEPVVLPQRHVIERVAEPVEHVLFVEDGLVSVVASAGGERIEVGLIGREGMTGTSVLMGGRAQHELIVQVSGGALRIPTSALLNAIAASSTLHWILLGYIHSQHYQASMAALANGRCTVEQRLARWLLMAHDRLGRAELMLTHETLATMLGVRRPGVTVALHILEGEHAIRSTRGCITILDRLKLSAAAGHGYGIVDGTYPQSAVPALDAASLGTPTPRRAHPLPLGG